MPHPEFLAGQTLPASKLVALAETSTYEPVLSADTTNPDLGTFGNATGEWYRTGRWLRVVFDFQFGTSGVSNGSGIYRVSMPPGMPPPQQALGRRGVFGVASLRDEGTSWRHYPIFASSPGSNEELVVMGNESGVIVTESFPWTWGTEDYLHGELHYLLDE